MGPERRLYTMHTAHLHAMIPLHTHLLRSQQ